MDLPHTYNDADGNTLSVDAERITLIDAYRMSDEMTSPKGEDAVDLAEAILASGAPDHVVIAKADLADGMRAALRAKATPANDVEAAK